MSMRQPGVSATAMDTYRDCPRKQAYRRKLGRTKQPESAKAGTDVHSLVHQYVRDRVLPDPRANSARHALAVLPHILPYVDTIRWELPFTAAFDGVPYRGRMDGLTDMTVVDLKTTADLQYAKTPAELLDDVQRTVYCTIAQRELGKWIYVTREREPKVRVVEVEEPLATTRERFAEYHITLARPVFALARLAPEAIDIDAYPRRFEACDKYSGCPYRSLCHADLSPEQRRSLLAAAIQKGKPDESQRET